MAEMPVVEAGVMPSCDPPCTGANVCDPEDNKCKPNGMKTNIGAPCDTSGADPKCGTDPRATCNDYTQDEFPGGYCSYEPCSTTQLCPIGSSCARLGGEPSACWKNCKTDADCQNRPNGMDYECLAVDPLFTSGASHKVCYLKALACATQSDCPTVKPTCTSKTCN
jgi:hypothetical protein